MTGVVGRSLSLNRFTLLRVWIPYTTAIEVENKASIDAILIAIRDTFGSKEVPLDDDLEFIFDLPVAGCSTKCLAKFELVSEADGTADMKVIDVREAV
jgi:hypothetical protein